VNSINVAGWTPLHDAVERGDAGVVAALLAAGADPDCVITGGKRAGMSARDMGLAKVIVAGSVADPSGPYVFGPRGSGSISQRFGSGSFCHRQK
jgi:hypothetical protein